MRAQGQLICRLQNCFIHNESLLSLMRNNQLWDLEHELSCNRPKWMEDASKDLPDWKIETVRQLPSTILGWLCTSLLQPSMYRPPVEASHLQMKGTLGHPVLMVEQIIWSVCRTESWSPHVQTYGHRNNTTSVDDF